MTEHEPSQFPFEDPNVDSARLDQALSQLPAEPMPEPVWESLQAALAAESAARAEAHASQRPSNRGRWLLGAAAAAAVVIVGGVWINGQNTEPQPVAVASGDEQASSAPAAPMTQSPAAPAVQAPRGSGGMIQTASFPARKVVATNTNYAKSSMPTQVGELLWTAGVRSASDIEKALPVESEPQPVGTDGFTATMEGLRSCVTAITKNAAAQALIIDRALFEGNDAGIVVMPAGSGSADSPSPTMTAETTAGPLDVWVVEPDCAVVDPHVMLHMLHEMVTETTDFTPAPASTDTAVGESADSSVSP